MKVYYLLTNTYIVYKYVLNRQLICSFCDLVHCCKQLICGFSRLLEITCKEVFRRDLRFEVTDRLILHAYV
jgi:hypothetical protein